MAVAGLCVLLIMFVVTYDAISRYLFNAPLSWSFELVTYYLMVVAVYFALSSTFTHGDHINLDLFLNMMSARPRARVESAWSLISAVGFAIIAWGTWENTLHAYQRNEFLPGIIVWPAWLSHLPVPLGTGLIALRLALHSWTLARRGEDSAVEAPKEPME